MAETRWEQLKRQSRVLRKLAPHANPPLSDLVLAQGPVTVGWTANTTGLSSGAWAALLGYDRLLSLTVKRGREQPGEQPATGTLSFAFALRDQGELDALYPGKMVEFRVTPTMIRFLLDLAPGEAYSSDAEQNVFRAFVTDARLDYVPQADQAPPAPIVTVTCQGPRGRGAQVRIGDTPWGAGSGIYTRLQQVIGATKTALLDSAGDWTDAAMLWNGFLVFAVGDAADYPVIARDVDRQPPDGLLDSLAADVGAVWGESLRRPGLVWQGIDARGDRDPLVDLTADEIARTATWSRQLSGTVNRYTVEAGPEGARTSVTVEDPASIDSLGEFGMSRGTALWDLDDARRTASLVVGRNSRPAWSITQLDVDLLDLKLPKAKAAALLLRADLGSLITVSGLPLSAPQGRYFIVEGTEIRLDRHNASLTVYVSDASRTGAPMTWEDVPAALTWADVDPAMTWLQSAGWFEPPPLIYRWADVPADQAWYHLRAGEDREPGGSDAVPTWESYPNDPA